ncbi:hypothetical protein VNO77_16277 [Canavalia gladiata]|uniref:Uncharacterized protein n=1 Tax=Canavalia gladiata TaxID=3824 RepID=A0AAN9M3T9_CANGL
MEMSIVCGMVNLANYGFDFPSFDMEVYCTINKLLLLQCKALLKLKQRIVSDSFGEIAPSPCNWFEIECSDGRVVVFICFFILKKGVIQLTNFTTVTYEIFPMDWKVLRMKIPSSHLSNLLIHLMHNIEPLQMMTKCLHFIDIIQICLNCEPDERPTMGEVEVTLEHALLLQELADIRNTNY